MLTATTAARPEYSDTFSELVTNRAKKMPPTTAAISNRNNTTPLMEDESDIPNKVNIGVEIASNIERFLKFLDR